MSVLWLPFQAFTFLVRSGNQQLAESPLCETGVLLFLALVHHAPAGGHQNPFYKAVQQLQVRAAYAGLQMLSLLRPALVLYEAVW